MSAFVPESWALLEKQTLNPLAHQQHIVISMRTFKRLCEHSTDLEEIVSFRRLSKDLPVLFCFSCNFMASFSKFSPKALALNSVSVKEIVCAWDLSRATS